MSQRELATQYPNEIVLLGSLLEKIDTDHPTDEDRRAVADFLDKYPHIWRFIGDLMEQAMISLIGNLDASAVARAGLQAAVEQLPHDLTRPGDGPLEHLLVQQVTMCWLRLAYVEYQYSAVSSQSTTTTAQLTYWDKRLNAAQRRYLRAIETLARVRKLTLPAMQVNIGQQQVNQVMGGQGPE